MKILHINDYESSGGAEIIFNNIYTELGGEKFVIYNYISKNIILKNFQKFFFSFKIYFNLNSIIKNKNITHILLHNYNLSPLTILFLLNKKLNTTQIIHACGQTGCPSSWGVYRKNYKKCDVIPNYKKCLKMCAYDKNKFLFSYYYIWNKFVVYFRKKKINKFISPSNALKDVLISNKFGNIFVLNNYINIVKNSNDKNIVKENIILYVGQINKLKGVGLLLKVFNKIELNNWKLYIIGGGVDFDYLYNKYESINITFLGKLENKDVINYYKKSKIVVLPSIWFENYPTVALEAYLYGCKVIGSDRGGIPEIIGKENTFDILDEKSIKDKILDTLKSFDNSSKIVTFGKDNYYKKLKDILNIK